MLNVRFRFSGQTILCAAVLVSDALMGGCAIGDFSPRADGVIPSPTTGDAAVSEPPPVGVLDAGDLEPSQDGAPPNGIDAQVGLVDAEPSTFDATPASDDAALSPDAAPLSVDSGADSAHVHDGAVDAAVSPLVASLSITSDWGTGYCAEIRLSNAAVDTVSNWSVVFDPLSQAVTQAWDATVAPSGALYKVTPLSWNASIAPGTSATWGFCANEPSSHMKAVIVSVGP